MQRMDKEETYLVAIPCQITLELYAELEQVLRVRGALQDLLARLLDDTHAARQNQKLVYRPLPAVRDRSLQATSAYLAGSQPNGGRGFSSPSSASIERHGRRSNSRKRGRDRQSALEVPYQRMQCAHTS